MDTIFIVAAREEKKCVSQQCPKIRLAGLPPLNISTIPFYSCVPWVLRRYLNGTGEACQRSISDCTVGPV